MIKTLTLIFLFPLSLSGLYSLAYYLEHRQQATHQPLNWPVAKMLGLTIFGFLATIPTLIHHNQDNLHLFWHGTDKDFMLEYLSDNFSSFILVFPILLMMVFIVESLFPHFKIQKKRAKQKQLLREFFLCLTSMLCFAPSVFLIAYLSNYSWYHMYQPYDLHGTPYFIFSIIAMLTLHEIYFYSEHRLMHNHKWLYRHVHHVHHLSNNPTVFTTYALHPIEALLAPLSYVFAPLIMPVSYEALIIALLIAELVNLMGHHGCEWFPGWLAKAPVLKYLNRATFHNMHHSHGGRSNFGYYTCILDKVLGTLHKDSEATFAAIVSRRKQNTATNSN